MLQTENRITERYKDSGLQDRMARHTCFIAVQGIANTGTKPDRDAARAALGATMTQCK